MASRLVQLARLAIPSRMVRAQVLALGIIGAVLAMVVVAAGGFVFVSTQQEQATGMRERGLALRALGDAVAAADADVRAFVASGNGDLGRYFESIEVIRTDGPGLERLNLTAATYPSSRPDATLEGDWSEAIRLAASGRRAEAAEFIVTQGTAARTAALVAAAAAEQGTLERAAVVNDERIRVSILLVLVLQVCSGTLALCGLVYAFRSSAAESAGRSAALASADSSREQVARLFEMADVLQSAADYGDANAVLKATAADLVSGVAGALYVFNNSRDRLVLSTAWGREGNEALPETITPADCWALKRGKPHINHEHGTKLCCAHHQGAETVLEIPMIARGEILGLLQLFATGVEAEAQLATARGLGSALADGMSLALANMGLREKLRNQALRDPLTGLYNRRYMEDALHRFVRLAERESRELSVLMIDLDHFKRLNDQHGHAFGDQVLREAAMTLLGSVRETDIVCRYGGEELVVILPDCNIERAADKAELLRVRIEDLSGKLAAEISASFGVAALSYSSGNIADLLAAADGALYKAKQAGRNQVIKAANRQQRVERTLAVAESAPGPEDEESPREAAE